ncbi:sigma-54 interaction domain-containing protein [Bacillus sp. UMB0728]|uniref:sigma-54 interaction domain-containing protein n=1 Tax=Bacillus sp. UMB0728 TaxID=2066052 RepID=UPI000C791EAD|nr:sigma 54-interacting transcriptional regulator [Bacillus sp. UMB0728]PLR73168.1 transcriptional regulator [Bacillus sp. UMB0728]
MIRILIVTYTENTLSALVQQLNEIGLQEHFEIDARTVDKLDHSMISTYSLVLVSSHIVYTMAKPYLPADMPYIITKRTINYGKIRELLTIPKGSKVYLVSDLKQSAEETIDVLKEAGIELDFYPFYSQEEPRSNVDVAITAGEPQIVPKKIRKIINIGSRHIDISTLVEIFHHFKLSPFTSTPRLSARFMQSLVDLTKDLSDEILKSKVLQKSLESMVQHMDDAVLSYNNEKRIEHYNKKAADILNLSDEYPEHPFLHDIPSSYYEAMMGMAVGQENFVEINDIAYYMRKKRIIIDEQVYATLIIFGKVEEYQKIEHDYRFKAKQKNLVARYTFDDMKTGSKPVLDMIKIAGKLARSDSTILILGETGTGKEVLAQAIHNASQRSYQPFIGVNFAAISESLMESELFGYESGAFTGARKNGHIGMFEQAHKGSIFLDEIGDASPVIQNRLLRVLQERQIMRVGGDRMIPLDVRVIAATNKDLNKLIEEGSFREDLYYRLNVLPLRLLPLRERKQDISLLINMFIKEFQEKLGRTGFNFSSEALKVCENYHWPGNIRELRNVVEYAAHICCETVYKEELPIWESGDPPFEQENDSSVLAFIQKELMEKGFLEESLVMLDYLNSKEIRSAGRPALCRHLKESGLLLSDQQLRYRQKLLSQHNLITIEKGRAGSSITEKGMRFLELEKIN